MKQEITPILENYLESIYNLEVEKNFKEAIRITDIADVVSRYFLFHKNDYNIKKYKVNINYK